MPYCIDMDCEYVYIYIHMSVCTYIVFIYPIYPISPIYPIPPISLISPISPIYPMYPFYPVLSFTFLSYPIHLSIYFTWMYWLMDDTSRSTRRPFLVLLVPFGSCRLMKRREKKLRLPWWRVCWQKWWSMAAAVNTGICLISQTETIHNTPRLNGHVSGKNTINHQIWGTLVSYRARVWVELGGHFWWNDHRALICRHIPGENQHKRGVENAPFVPPKRF